MKQRRSREEIEKILQQAEGEIAAGKTVDEVATGVGVSVPTFYLWRRKYGGSPADPGRRLKELEEENALLKRLVAEQALELLRLREAFEEA